MSPLIEEYERVCKHEQPWVFTAETTRQAFIQKFPVSCIDDLKLEDYLIGKDGIGNNHSFCRMMRYDLRGSASLGNVRFNIFGIYYDSDGNIALSPTFKNMFGNNTDEAFGYIKKEITNVLKAAEEDDYERIVSSKLNSSFRYKLITVYYVDQYIPVVTNSVLNEYCNHVGLSVDEKEPMIYRNLALKKWKENNPETANWTNTKLMGFCDWLWRNNRYYIH